MRRLLLALTLALALAPLAQPAGAPPVRLAPLPLDADAPAGAVSAGAEPMLLVAPDGTLLVGDTAGVHRSADGGASWARSGHPFLAGFFSDGRALALDDAGRLYAAHTQGQVIGVAASENLGASWAYTSSVVGAAAIADRPWLAANGDGKVALVYYSFPVGGEQCAYSTDAGRTWLVRGLTNAGPPNAGNLVLDDAGRLWYSDGARVLRWAQPCQGGLQFGFLPASGAQIFTQVAVTDAGDAFVAQPSPGNGRMELRGMHGVNAASTKVVAVSDPALGSNTFGALAARSDGSEVAVAWYGSATPGNPSAASFAGAWDVYVARVAGFWSEAPTVTVTKVTATPNHVGGFCMQGVTCSTDRDLLDYFGVAYDAAGNVHVAYGDDATGGVVRVRHAVVPVSGP